MVLAFGVSNMYPGQSTAHWSDQEAFTSIRVVLEALEILFLCLSMWFTSTELKAEVYVEDVAFSQVIILSGLYCQYGFG